MTLFTVLGAGCLSLACLLAGRTLIHWFQLESYQHPGYFRTLRRNSLRALLPGLILSLALCIAAGARRMIYPVPFPSWIPLAESIPPLAAGIVLYVRAGTEKAKKPLVFTARLKRLMLVTFLLNFALLFLTGCVFGGGAAPRAVFLALLPLWIALDGLLAWPVEKAISEMYFRDAQRILREHPDLIRIGITGSWGKTSVKFILGSILQEKYNTLITPRSFNTPMGVTRVIRTQLEPGHRIFIAEMGARHVGDIREMCRLVHPQMGILTSVGPQHLDTFKTLDRIRETKYELIEAIPENGACFFADDEDIVLDLYRRTEKEKYLAGMSPDRDDVWAEELRVSPEGSHFLLCTKDVRIPCHTELLGELNIRNIVLCASVCLKLGMTLREIARGISHLQSVEHRLQMVRNPGGITVIDDAFNSNIRGAKQAFAVLRDFPGKRIVVTPGMVELGDQEEIMNREFGRSLAPCCDLAVLVGRKRSRSIIEGLKEAGFREEMITVVGSLSEAAEYLAGVTARGDTILFENDLPDNYSE